MSPDASVLAGQLARQIEGSGPISVAEYMRQANATYYSNGDPFGVAGDFITAPEISQMFGELVGMWLTDLWMRQNRPEACHYVELGPGRGTLAVDALRAMARFDFSPGVQFVETSDTLRTKQRQAVPQASFVDNIDALPSDAPLLIVANEFFDALPIRQVVATHSGWREQVVVRGGDGFAVVPGTYKMDDQVPAEFRNAPTGSIFESSPDAANITYALATRLAKQGGALLVIDYGYSQPSLGSTLQAVRDHQYADPFSNPGQHDLTAHVDFSTFGRIAASLGLQVSGPVPQGDWLQALGIDQRAAILARATPEKAEDIAAARQRLVNADQMGQLFKVMAISASNWPMPEGFAAFS